MTHVNQEHKIGSAIVDGPSKFDLMLALFEGKIVDFTIKSNDIFYGNGKLSVSIKVIDNSKVDEDDFMSWRIEGEIKRADGNFNPLIGMAGKFKNILINPIRFSGFYSFRNRRGVMMIIVN